MNYRGHRYLDMSVVMAAQVQNVKILVIFGSQKQLFLSNTDLCKLWSCRMIHIFLSLSEVNASKVFSLFYGSYLDKYIESDIIKVPHVILAINWSKYSIKEEKTLPNLKLPCYLRDTETFFRTVIKMEIPLTDLGFLFLIFCQYRLCTKCSHFLCMCDQVIHYNGFLRMNIESGTMENEADWLKALTHRQFWVQKYTLSPSVSSSLGFSWENFFCIMHTVLFFPCLLPVESGQHYNFSLPEVFYDFCYH